MRIVLITSLIAVAAASVRAAEIPLVAAGRPTAVIVTADKPTAVASYAAEELAAHVQKATGVRLPIVAERVAPTTEFRVLVGDSRAVRELGIDVSKLPPETFVLRTQGKTLAIAGDDGFGDPLDADTRAGTLFGVYECLERAAGVRWLWPGELGTYVPKSRTVAIDVADAEIAPRFIQRRLRTGTGFTTEHPALGFSPEALKNYEFEQAVFLRRHRMGRSYPLGYRHAFDDWWKKYGGEHPEWFQLNAAGKRGPTKPTARFSMCVSNPEFQRQIVANWEAARRPDSRTPSFINACENDILGLCACEACRACDGPAPPDFLTYYPADSKLAGSRFVSDRYARFWLNVQQLAAAKDPQATVVGYVYFNYFSAPTTGIRLNPQIMLGYCPSAGWFPRSAAEHDWMKAQWIGWRDTGARMFMRTNHLLDGYCMPYIFAHQFADDFQHAVREGMVATDFDSLTGHWAAQGPNLYTAARLHVRPEAAIDDVLAEYYAAFGPAADEVRAYFDYWERYTTDHREQIIAAMQQQQAARWRNFAKAAHLIYPPESFAPAEALLVRATEAAGSDMVAAARVEFLRLGLEHAKLCAATAAKINLIDGPASDVNVAAAVKELVEFRRKHAVIGISNFNHTAWQEDLSWKLPTGIGKSKAAPKR